MKQIVSLAFILLLVVSSSGQDQQVPQDRPPGGLNVEEAPQFIVIGFDDNTEAAPLQWILDFMKDKKNPTSSSNNPLTFDGLPIRTSFYLSPQYNVNNQALKDMVKRAYDEGHEIGNHTSTHPHNYKMNSDWTSIEEILMVESDWISEINACTDWLVGCGIPEDKIVGFRCPFLEYSASTFNALNNLGFTYDCSIEEGFQYNMTGSKLLWPYTLDWGSPGNKILVSWGSKADVPEIAGLWDVPNYIMTVPPDNLADKYEFDMGLRKRMFQTQSWFDTTAGKVTGFDYNLWGLAAEGAFELKANEFLAILKYTLDLRYEGNRAPLMVGAHTQFYEDAWSSVNAPNASTAEMRKSIEDFIDYALTLDDVRIVPAIKIIEWCRNPIKLGTTPISHTPISDNKPFKASIGVVTPETIKIIVPSAGNYSLDVYTLAGEKIAAIQKGFLTRGAHIIYWQGQQFSRQTYLVTLKGSRYKTVKRAIF